MPFQTRPPRLRHLAAAIGATVALAACGGGDDETAQPVSPVAPEATTSDQPSGDAGAQSPFTAVIECLRAEGLDLDQPAAGGLGRGDGPPGRGSLPPGGSVPEGRFPGGSVPEGRFPGGSVPEGGFPRGTRPEGAPPNSGEFPGRDDPASLAGALGLDANDPDVTAAIDTCSDQLVS